MDIANNEVARVYNEMQNAVDWATASDQEQVNAMENMLHYLKQQEGTTPLFTFTPWSNRNVYDQIDYLECRLWRLRSRLK